MYSDKFVVLFFFQFFGGDKSPFCGAIGTLCYGLKLTLPKGFKARVDLSSSALCFCM